MKKHILLDITGIESELEELAKEAFPKLNGTGNKKKTAEALLLCAVKRYTGTVLKADYYDHLKEL